MLAFMGTKTGCRRSLQGVVPEMSGPPALGLAPRTARLTLAFLPSMMGLGSLQADSAPSLVAMITCTIRGFSRLHNGTEKVKSSVSYS